mmetsp:Transcript_14465/g.28944  ORF Transcript_14465/g.28944 Transcript_14465/m.28944 type:complete len:778 (-) Transcript_14465:48-2381(-)|eukprot:CAMPEP_0194315358 /NCGR_PEP_ID=MMETSP0171-20130528/12171_1 /TAXON_ID=218684 /ORGANISM="Corethron pennatum, Strain L29A3" /LENGTH=777 /DNA_ID=CAMNT_0039071145 /DNA_START=93 /DNA_END=2426 /DNA_ORIENTATION=+
MSNTHGSAENVSDVAAPSTKLEDFADFPSSVSLLQSMHTKKQDIPSNRSVGRGISNLGNTCYVNAVLQSLAHAPDLCQAIENQPHRLRCPIFIEQQKSLSIRENTLGSASEGDENKKDDNEEKSNDCCILCEIESHICILHWNKNNRSDITDSKKIFTNQGKVSSTACSSPVPMLVQCTGNGPLSKDNAAKSTDVLNKLDNNADLNLKNIIEEKNDFIKDLNIESLSGPVAPKSLVEGIFTSLAPGLFRRGMQEDSHEFLRLLIDGMQRSEGNAVKYVMSSEDNFGSKNGPGDGPVIRKTRSQKRKELEQIEIDKKEEQDKEETRSKLLDQCYPYQLFRGTVESIVTCPECNETSKTTDPMEDVGLEVEQSVSAGLKRFVRSEVLDEYLCTSTACGKKKVRATKQSKFASIPPVLTLHLKRFRYGSSFSANSSALNYGGSLSGFSSRRGSQSHGENSRGGNSSSVNGIPGLSLTSVGGRGGSSGSAKIEGHIKFENLFDMRPYLTDTLQNKFKNMLCRLFAVVVHSGKSAHSGHYFAYVQSLVKNEWWKMDDGSVQLVTQNEVMASEAYMLFYRLVNPNQSVPIKRKNIGLEKESTKLEKNRIPETTTKPEFVSSKALGDSNKKIKLSEAGVTKISKKNNDEKSSLNVERKRRKRVSPSLKNGPEWSKRYTINPDVLVSSITHAEEWISEHVEFTSSFFEDLQNEAKEVEERNIKGENVDLNSQCLVDKEDIQDGGYNGLRIGLLNIFSQLHKKKEFLSSAEIPLIIPLSENQDNLV